MGRVANHLILQYDKRRMGCRRYILSSVASMTGISMNHGRFIPLPAVSAPKSEFRRSRRTYTTCAGFAGSFPLSMDDGRQQFVGREIPLLRIHARGGGIPEELQAGVGRGVV